MLQIANDLCVGCGVCEDNCAFGGIAVIDGVAVLGDSCVLCGACVDACEPQALTIEGLASGVEADQLEWNGIWVYCEYRAGKLAPVALELLGIGRRLADDRGVELAAVLLGSQTGETADRLIAHGADRVYRADDPALADFNDESYSAVMTALIRDQKPEVVLAGATAIGRSFIPGVANLLGAGLTADCTQLAIRPSDGALLQTRPAFGGNIMATITCPSKRPQMATVRPNVMQAQALDSKRSGEVIDVDLDQVSLLSKIRFVESVFSEQEDVNIQESEILVGGGRGVEGTKGLALVTELANTLSAGISASRALVDAGWLGYPHQVGQTGKTVAPKLYIACGISGAIQHVAGMQSSETIVAINRDPHAPIFDVADIGIVGDLFEVLPKLISTIEEQRNS